MKKIFTSVAVAVFLFVCMAGLLMAEPKVFSVEELAYMDIDLAPQEMRDDIFAAREEIIFSHSWVADIDDFSYVGELVDDETGEVIEILPKFSDLFPEDWDLPIALTMDEVAFAPIPGELFFGIVFLGTSSNPIPFTISVFLCGLTVNVVVNAL